VSTTHVLSSGIAGTMTASGARLAMAHGAQHLARLGVHPAGGDASFRGALLDSIALFSSTSLAMSG
jgi:phosphate/sulfate permease